MLASTVFLQDFRIALIGEDTCPECLGELDTGWECNRCNFDAAEEMAEAECRDTESEELGSPISTSQKLRNRRRKKG